MTKIPPDPTRPLRLNDQSQETTRFTTSLPAADDSPPALLDQLLEEFTQRLRAGETPTISEFQQRHPDLSDDIQELLASVVMIEQLKSPSTDSPVPPADRLAGLGSLTNIGGYKIIGELGRGGMGVVFEAVHETLGRRVAIKVMPTPLVDGEKHLARFRQEARSAAKLHHTNIVGVFGVGHSEGIYYYVMDLVEGRPLNDVIASLDSKATSAPETDTPAYFRWAANLGVRVADALDYAHAAKILHRDIKPSNLLLDKNEVVWITDFGLAKDGAIDSNLTATGTVLGTPQYMAPESLEGIYDVRSETYCLGLTLYELVARQPAFAAGTPAEVIRAITTQTPTALKTVNPRLPVDLRTIIQKAIAREPAQRYPDAGTLRNDLLAFVEERPISARRPSTTETLIRWGRRNPVTAALSAVSALLLALVAVTASVGYIATTDALSKEAQKSEHLKIQQQQTERARREAVENFDQMKQQFARADANVATTIRAFDEVFKHIIARDSNNTDIQVDGLRQILGIESSITTQDATFLEKLVAFYEEFANNNADNQTLQAESAKAFRRVGNIYQRVGQMQPAIEAYNKSLQLYEHVFESQPESKQALLTITGIQYELGSASLKNGDAVQAHQWNEMAIQRLEQSELFATDPEVSLELARTLSAMALNIYRIANVTNPLKNHRPPSNDRLEVSQSRGREKDRSQANFQPNTTSSRPSVRNKFPGDRARKRFHEFMRLRGGQSGLTKRNRQLVARAIEIADALVAQSPGNADYVSVQATCLFIAAAARMTEDPIAGLQLRDRAIASLETLSSEYPDNAEYRYLLALACSLGDSSTRPDDIQLLGRAVQIVDDLLQLFPTNLDYHHLNASLRIQQARHWLAQQKLDATLNDLRAAKDSLQVLHQLTPSDRSYRATQGLALATLQKLADGYDQRNQPDRRSETNQLRQDLRDKLRPSNRGRRRQNTNLSGPAKLN